MDFSGTMDVNDVMKLLPHRYPFLLIDRVTEIELGERLVAIKNVSYNEPFFQGHFPGNPIVPGVLILEEVFDIFAQDNPGVNLAGFSSVKFLQPLLPEQAISVEFKLTDATRVRFGCSNGKAVFVKGELKLSQHPCVD